MWTGGAAPARLPRSRVVHAQPSAVRGQRAERSDMACGKRRGRLCGIKEVRMVSHAGDAGRDRRATSYFFTRERVVRVGTGVGCVHSTKWVTLWRRSAGRICTLLLEPPHRHLIYCHAWATCAFSCQGSPTASHLRRTFHVNLGNRFP